MPATVPHPRTPGLNLSPDGEEGEGDRLTLLNLPRQMLLAGIRVYQLTVGPALPPVCRYEPTCSRYAYAAIQRHGAARGSWLALRRVLRCHPFGGSGYDPVP